MTVKFKSAELQCFNWLYSLSPCFPMNSSKISIINEPRKFYDRIFHKLNNAKRRIAIASLYIGTGKLERKLFQIASDNIESNKDLKMTILLDYQRGTRDTDNSKTLLQKFYTKHSDHCRIMFYQTPRLYGSWSKLLPSRYNEIIGLQHMKLYITDDSVLISGANCSNDYFCQRQDRYIEITDMNLANFYVELIDNICEISKKAEKEGFSNVDMVNKYLTIKKVNENLNNMIERWKSNQEIYSSNVKNGTNIDTWVFPLIQMGEFGIKQDEIATHQIFKSVPKDSLIRLATGYFNLTENYAATLLKLCKANISLLMAHPNANGFMGAAGPAGGIPYAYSLLAKKFWKTVLNMDLKGKVKMLEYERSGWTFHAKGLWYYPPGSEKPWATVVGSANLGERSVRRDLEAQAAILTISPQLQQALHEECTNLHKAATECGDVLMKREVPFWVQLTVKLFQSYF